MTDYEAMTDRELAIAAGNGDERGLATLYDRCFPGVYDFAVRTLREPDVAADIVRETFAEASRGLGRGTVPENVKAWLHAIALREAMAKARQTSPPESPRQQQTGLPSFVEIDVSRARDLQAVQEDRELRELVWESAAQLSPREYALLDLNLRRELDADEVATAVGIGAASAEATLSTVRDSLEKAAAASLLVRRGRRECPELAGLLAQSTAPETSPEVRQAVLGHLQTCARCQAIRAAHPAPLRVFAGFAGVPAAAGLKEVIWGNVLAATAAATPAAATAPAPARRSRAPLLIALLLAVAAVVVAVPLILLLTSSGDDGVGDPDDIRSSSHEIGEPSTDPVVRLVWSRQEGALAYSVSWSADKFELPDEVGDLSGDATDATSPELTPGDWYFHLRTRRDDGTWTNTVHVGPFKIVAEETPTAEPTLAPTPTPEVQPTPTEGPMTPEPTSETETPTPEPTETPIGGAGVPS